MLTRVKTILLMSAATVCVSAQAQAAGFYLQEHSTTAAGAQFAGANAQPRDASIIYYNPAGMTHLSGPQYTGSIEVIIGQNDTSDTGSTLFGAPVGGGDGDGALPVSPLINGFFAMPVAEDLWVGLGITTPFGLSTVYDENWVGRYDSIKTSITTIDIQPSIAYRVMPWLSVGGGVDIQYVDTLSTKAVHNGITEGNSRLEADDWSVGFNAGILLDLSEATRVGLHYRSKMNHTVEGDIDVAGVVGLNESSTGSADIDLPDVVSIGVAHDVNDQWTALAQFNWFGWSTFQDLTVVRSNGTIAESILADYDDSFSIAVGAEYKWDENLTLRGGYQYDDTPTHDATRSTSVMDGDRHNFSMGASYNVNDRLSLSGAATLGFLSDETVNVTRNAGFAAVNLKREDTTYEVISMGLTYKF